MASKGTSNPAGEAAAAASEAKALAAFQAVVKALEPLDKDARTRLIKAAAVMFGMEHLLRDNY